MATLANSTPALLLATTLLLLLLQIQPSQPCLCSILRNFKCPSAPACCESGQYTLDECGCCQKCAKAELQKCGGASDISGKCAGGLQCLKTCLPCKTVGDAGRPCIFPFKYIDVTYDKCTSKDSDNGQPWCATEVDEEGYVVDNAWGDCLEGCPGSRLECDEKYFSIQEGKCIDISVPGAIPNWFGAPAVKLESPTRDLFQAPACKSKKGSVRFYDNTCRCVRGESAIDLSTNGQIRGNCTGLEDDSSDNLDKVWCFLENIRDPLNPSSGCYSDTKWSERDARFWSSLACFQSPDIEGREKSSINNRGFSNRIDKPYRPTTRKPTRPPTTTSTTTTTTIRTTTTSLAIGEIEQYTDGDEHFYFSEYYQDYQEEIDGKISNTEEKSQQSDYEDNNPDDLYNNDLANPIKLDDKSYTFLVGETNLPGFGRKSEIPKGNPKSKSTTTTTTTQEPLPARPIGPFLPTPSPIITTTTSNRRSFLRNRFKNRNRSRRPPNANPRKRPTTQAPNKRILATRFPNFRRRPQILRRTTERPRVIATTEASENLGGIAESPRSFLEGEFGENNIPIAIPLFENGELSDDIFKKIKKTPKTVAKAKKIPVPPVPPFGSVLAKVETETIKIDKEEGRKRDNILRKIPREKVTPKPKEEIQSGLLDLFGDIDVGINEVMSQTPIDVSLNEVEPEAPNNFKVDEMKQPSPIALPFILEEGTDYKEEFHKTTVPSAKLQTSTKQPTVTQTVSKELSTTKRDIIISLDDPINTIPNVFKYLPTLSTGRRDRLPPRRSDSKQDIHKTIKEEGQEVTQAQTGDKPKAEHRQPESLTAKLPNLNTIATKASGNNPSISRGSVESTKVSFSEKKSKKISKEVKPETQKKTKELHQKPNETARKEKTPTSISISKTVESQLKTKESDTNVEEVNNRGNTHSDHKIKSDGSDTHEGTFIHSDTHESAITASDTHKSSRTGINSSGTTLSDTALLSESLKNIVRSGITNQDNADKKAISEELKNIVRSGILDLGILGLWSKDPIIPSNTSPMPVFRPGK